MCGDFCKALNVFSFGCGRAGDRKEGGVLKGKQKRVFFKEENTSRNDCSINKT